MTIKSAYIHIPFCNKICSYCDFAKFHYNEKWVKEYIESLNREIISLYKGDILKTIYIGGGTPSSLSIDELKDLFNVLQVLKLDKKYEFTFECNMEDINEDLLSFLKDNKVNRLSIGLQSFNKDILLFLNRNNKIDIKEKINMAKKYFSNINIDLMYGVNNQTIKDLKTDLEEFNKLDIPHISIYVLILEEHTVLKTKSYKELPDDLQSEMYDLIKGYLKENNYIHYEISNFSKKGYQSNHNLTYWNNEKYYGFGLGSSGYINNTRYENTRNLKKYLNNEYVKEKHILTKKEDMENEMILGLRKIEGINKEIFKEKHNCQISDVFDTKKLKETKTHYYISENELFVSNYILRDFIDIN